MKTRIPADWKSTVLLANAFDRQGGEFLTTTRKTFVMGAALVIAFAGSVSASERSREAGTSDDADVSRPADAAMNFTRIDETSVMVNIDGQCHRLR